GPPPPAVECGEGDPGSGRWICGRQLVTGEVLDCDVDLDAAVGPSAAGQMYGRRLLLQKLDGAAAHAVELLWQCFDAGLVPIAIQHREQQEVAPKEGVLGKVGALETEIAGDRRGRVGDGHVTRLAARR